MRGTPDLIAELEEEAKNHWIVVMAIDFETSIIFVRAEDENRLAMLNSAVQAGGTPVGLIAADKLSGCELAMSMRVYPEHWDSKELDAEGYLLALIDQIGQSTKLPN
jgi:hypothetical protein